MALAARSMRAIPCSIRPRHPAKPEVVCGTGVEDTVGHVMDALATQEEYCYGEGLNMLEHALQAAHCATHDGEPNDAVLACLLHDVGNTSAARDVWKAETGEDPPMLLSPKDEKIGYSRHSDMGGAYLRHAGFALEVHNAVALHVAAKRALVAMDPSYMAELSQASVDTLTHQGGPLSPSELEEFHALPGSAVALRLRRHDDRAKEPGLAVPRLETYRELVREHLRQQPSPASELFVSAAAAAAGE